VESHPLRTLTMVKLTDIFWTASLLATTASALPRWLEDVIPRQHTTSTVYATSVYTVYPVWQVKHTYTSPSTVSLPNTTYIIDVEATATNHVLITSPTESATYTVTFYKGGVGTAATPFTTIATTFNGILPGYPPRKSSTPSVSAVSATPTPTAQCTHQGGGCASSAVVNVYDADDAQRLDTVMVLRTGICQLLPRADVQVEWTFKENRLQDGTFSFPIFLLLLYLFSLFPLSRDSLVIPEEVEC
jgi:hypothetical protein